MSSWLVGLAQEIFGVEKGWPESTWTIKTGETAEVDLTVVASSSGTFFLLNSDDPPEIAALHKVKYRGIGLTWSKGPCPFTFGGSYSLTDMPGGGVGKVKMRPDVGILTIDDFDGPGIIGSVAISIASGTQPGSRDTQGTAATVLFFGLPTIAIGVVCGEQQMLPGVGGTWLPCVFTSYQGMPGNMDPW